MTVDVDRQLPLEGVRVVDVSSYFTGPFGAMVLGDLGADVVKVERPPKGDPMRNVGHRYAGTGVMSVNVNRNKRSIFLDLNDEDDRAVFLGLIAWGDVLVENWRPGVAEALDLSDQVLVSRNSRLIRVSITGYGQDGPLADRPAFDSLIQAQTGLAHRQRQGDRPEPVRSHIADKITGLFAAQSVLAALVARSRTGRGERIDLSMLDAMSYFNFPDLMEDRTFMNDPAAETTRPIPRPFVLATEDGYLAVAPTTGVQLRSAFEAVGHPEWRDEVRSISDPVELINEVFDRLESVTVSDTSRVWLERFAAADVPAAPVLDPDAHLVDPQIVHNETYDEHEHADWGPLRAPRYPARFQRRAPLTLRLHAPRPDEHGSEIRREIERFREADEHG